MTEQAPSTEETVEKVQCRSYICAAMILPSTSKRNDGYCVPCRKTLRTRQAAIFCIVVLIPVIYIAFSPALTQLILDPILDPVNEFVIDPLVTYVLTPMMFLAIGFCWIYIAYSAAQPDMKSTWASVKLRGGFYGLAYGLFTLAVCLIFLNIFLSFFAVHMIAAVFSYAEPWFCLTGFDELTSSSSFRQYDLPGYVGWLSVEISCRGDFGQYPINPFGLIISTLAIYCVLTTLLVKLMNIFDRVFSFENNSKPRQIVSIALSVIIVGMPFVYNDIFTPGTRLIQKIHFSLSPDANYNLFMLDQIRRGKVENVKRLLQAGASARAYSANKPKQTALYQAAGLANPEIMRALLDGREDINVAEDIREAFVRSLKGFRSNDVETAKVFLDAGFDPSIIFAQGVSLDDLKPAMRHLIGN